MKTNFILLALLTVSLSASQALAQSAMNGWAPTESTTEEKAKPSSDDDDDDKDIAKDETPAGSTSDQLEKNMGFYVGAQYNGSAKQGEDLDAKSHGKGITFGLQTERGKMLLRGGLSLDSERKVIGKVDVSRAGTRLRCDDDKRIVCFDLDVSVDAQWAPIGEDRYLLAAAGDGSIVLRKKTDDLEVGVGAGPRIQGLSTNLVYTNDEAANAFTQGFQGFAYIDSKKINAIVGGSYGWNLADTEVKEVGTIDGRVSYKFKNGINLYAGPKVHYIRMVKETPVNTRDHTESVSDSVPEGAVKGHWVGGVDGGMSVKF